MDGDFSAVNQTGAFGVRRWSEEAGCAWLRRGGTADEWIVCRIERLLILSTEAYARVLSSMKSEN